MGEILRACLERAGFTARPPCPEDYGALFGARLPSLRRMQVQRIGRFVGLLTCAFAAPRGPLDSSQTRARVPDEIRVPSLSAAQNRAQSLSDGLNVFTGLRSRRMTPSVTPGGSGLTTLVTGASGIFT